jgi:hypothetical protein
MVPIKILIRKENNDELLQLNAWFENIEQFNIKSLWVNLMKIEMPNDIMKPKIWYR